MIIKEKKELDLTIKNLKIIRDTMPKLTIENPKIIKDFNMEDYGIYENKTKEQILNNECNTVGCLLGNSVFCFPDCINNPKFFNKKQIFQYYKFFNITFKYLIKYNNNDIFSFLFCNLWNKYQPKFEQAIERLNYLIYQLENNNFNFEWKYQKKSFKI